jgi:hypothetical protein
MRSVPSYGVAHMIHPLSYRLYVTLPKYLSEVPRTSPVSENTFTREREGLKGGREGSRHFLERMEAGPDECRGDWFLRAKDNRLVYVGPVGEDLTLRMNRITERVRAGTVTMNDTLFPPECWSRLTLRYRRRILKLRRYIKAGYTAIGRGIQTWGCRLDAPSLHAVQEVTGGGDLNLNFLFKVQ